MWEEVQKRVQESGNPVHLNTPVVKLYHDHSRVLEAEVQTHLGRRPVSARHFLSSVPLPRLIQMLDPPPPDPILEAASTLRYRDSITVNLIVNRASLFPDNWIYVHSDGARVARIQNYKNWSAAMVPDPETTSLGMEYFCFQGDDLWKRSSKQLIELAKKDLEILKLVHPEEVIDGFVYKETHAYPMYNTDYQVVLAMIRSYLSQFENLQTLGRNGLHRLHRYNNQDHSMLCALFAVEHLFGANLDVWDVNTDSEYQEGIRISSEKTDQLSA